MTYIIFWLDRCTVVLSAHARRHAAISINSGRTCGDTRLIDLSTKKKFDSNVVRISGDAVPLDVPGEDGPMKVQAGRILSCVLASLPHCCAFLKQAAVQS